MSSDFIIVTGEKKKPEPKDNSPKGLVEKWFSFSSVKNVSPKTVARLKVQVQNKLEAGVGQHLFSKISPKYKFDLQLKHCVKEVIREQWDSLTPEERLLILFPTVQPVGERFEIPKRGTGIIIQRELTRQFRVEMVFQLQDGSFFKHEFID
jgi:hypothetical protein